MKLISSVEVESSALVVAPLDTGTLEDCRDGLSVEAELVSQFTDRPTGFIARDQLGTLSPGRSTPAARHQTR